MENRGKQFDPYLVEAFLKLRESERDPARHAAADMSAGNLSRFFQAPVNAAIFAWYPAARAAQLRAPLGRLYFSKKPRERDRYLRALRETFSASRREPGSVDADLEKRVLHGIFDHYFEKMLIRLLGLRAGAGAIC